MPGAAAAVKPDDSKSATQETFDKARREKDAHSEGPSDKVSGTRASLAGGTRANSYAGQGALELNN